MSSISEIVQLFMYLGISVTAIALALIFALMLYPKVKIILSDILKIFGWVNKWFRKRSVELDIEGSINSFTHHFNSEVIEPFLPDCIVQWVSEENQSTVLEPGKAIVRVSFKGHDKNLNYYNATYSFVQTALLNQTKPFLRNNISNAIDLLVTKIILKGSRRPALTIFNNKFRDISDDYKETFFKLEETDREGLFKRILLQEYHFLGETIGDKSPDQSIEEETENFFEWFYSLATRELDEQTVLYYEAEHIRVGVVLVASDETYQLHGRDPYLRRANIYASKGFESIYFLSRGRRKGKILKDIVKELESTGCFSILTRHPDVKIKEKHDEAPKIISCIALRPDITTIVQKAWSRMQKAYDEKKTVKVTIESVTKDSIDVDAYGLRASIPRSSLSSLSIADARQYFREYTDLSVKVVNIDPINNDLELSNIDTDTDPQKYIETLEEKLKDTPSVAKVEAILDHGGYEFGMIAKIAGVTIGCYIPRLKATKSRFISLSKKYPIGAEVRIIPLSYNTTHARFECSIDELEDPWSNINQYQVNNQIETIIRQITERYIICELEEGLEGRIYVEELSWQSIDKNLENIKEFKVGEKIKVKVVHINTEKKYIILSVKRLANSPTEDYCTANKGKIVEATIQSVSSWGATVLLGEDNYEGNLHISEILWGYCDNIYNHINKGRIIEVKIMEYDPRYNRISVSKKQTVRNDYKEFEAKHKMGDDVIGTIKSLENDRFSVEIKFSDNMIAQAYIHCSELSNILFIDENIIASILKIGKEYTFIIKRIYDDIQVIELSRGQLFLKNYDKLEYGKEYSGRYISSSKGAKNIIQTDKYEGNIVASKFLQKKLLGDVKVIIARKDDTTKMVEFQVI